MMVLSYKQQQKFLLQEFDRDVTRVEGNHRELLRDFYLSIDPVEGRHSSARLRIGPLEKNATRILSRKILATFMVGRNKWRGKAPRLLLSQARDAGREGGAPFPLRFPS